MGSTTRRMEVQADQGIKQDPISKITKAKMAKGRAKVVQCLTSKCKALSLTTGTAKKTVTSFF
jgi:hypothetical protein